MAELGALVNELSKLYKTAAFNSNEIPLTKNAIEDSELLVTYELDQLFRGQKTSPYESGIHNHSLQKRRLALTYSLELLSNTYSPRIADLLKEQLNSNIIPEFRDQVKDSLENIYTTTTDRKLRSVAGKCLGYSSLRILCSHIYHISQNLIDSYPPVPTPVDKSLQE